MATELNEYRKNIIFFIQFYSKYKPPRKKFLDLRYSSVFLQQILLNRKCLFIFNLTKGIQTYYIFYVSIFKKYINNNNITHHTFQKCSNSKKIKYLFKKLNKFIVNIVEKTQEFSNIK